MPLIRSGWARLGAHEGGGAWIDVPAVASRRTFWDTCDLSGTARASEGPTNYSAGFFLREPA